MLLSVGVLFVLARFRFPDRAAVALPAQPLERLAARAAFDDLTGIVARASARVRPSLEVIVAAADGLEPRSLVLEDVLLAGPAAATRRVLGYRFAPAAVLVVTPSPIGEPGVPLASRSDLRPRAHDGLRGLGVLDAEAPPAGWEPLPTGPTPGPAYLLVADAGHGGPALRPLFGSLAEPSKDPRWDGPLVSLGPAVQASHGTLVFSLEGALVGAVQSIGGVQTIVPADLLLAAATRLGAGDSRSPSTLGISLQALSDDLALATRVRSGALVADSGTLVATPLEPGDVIVAVDGTDVATPESALLAIARLRPGVEAPLRVVRDGTPIDVRVTPVAASGNRLPPTTEGLGLTLRRTPLGAEVLAVSAGSVGARAGLRVGDTLVRVGGTARPTPAQVMAAYENGGAAALLIAIERGGRTMMLALREAGS